MIDDRLLALPDFQRSFVWDPNATEMLIESIAQNYPAGSLLLMPYRKDLFALREFEGAQELNGGMPQSVVLDGQQRLTSLYQAFEGKGTHRYFVDMKALASENVEEAIFHETAFRAERRELHAPETQAAELIFPLAELFRAHGFTRWRDDVLKLRAEHNLDSQLGGRPLGSALLDLHTKWLEPIELYEFPVVALNENTPIDAVCTIFEVLNNTGVQLSVFELLTARFWPADVDLRGLWARALDDYPLLRAVGLDPYYVLQAIVVGLNRAAPTRSEVLKLSATDIVDRWERTARGFHEALKLLRDECGLVREKWLPYQPLLLPLAALWSEVMEGGGALVGERRRRLVRWYWCSVLGQTYENAVNTQARADYQQLMAWLKGDASLVPDAIRHFDFDSARLRETTPRQRALYRGLIGLIARHGARDFYRGERLTWETVHDKDVEDHHIFPRNYLATTPAYERVTGTPEQDCILNRTLIDRTTNASISDDPPSRYLSRIEDQLRSLGPELGKSQVDSILETHLLPGGPESSLRQDDFHSMLQYREHMFVREIHRVTGLDSGIVDLAR